MWTLVAVIATWLVASSALAFLVGGIIRLRARDAQSLVDGNPVPTAHDSRPRTPAPVG